MKKRILVVEYDAQTVELIRDAFPPSTFDLTVVDEGQKARDTLARNAYDLVITAAMLPKFHGFNLSQFIHEQYPDTRIIIISGIYKEIEYKRQVITQYNADDFFQKPLKAELLRNRAMELLNMDPAVGGAGEAAATMEFPAADTSKIPSVSDQPQTEGNRFSSDDLFGDIIEKVESEAPQGNDATPPKPASPPPAPSPPREERKKANEDDGVLDLTDADLIPVSPKTTEMPSPPPQSRASSFKAITSDDIDASLNNLLSKKTEKAPDTQRFKKIEDDFSKKFEDTLSGLGLDKKKKKAPPAPPAPPVTPDFRTQEMPVPPEKPPKADTSSSELGDYDILGLIARGGMAEIYKAKKKGVKGFEKVLAIKKILSGYGQDDKYIEMFVDEAKIAAELTHPNIVQIYDLGKKDDYYFIAMEYVQGKDLRVILKRLAGRDRDLPEELAVFLTIKVLEALSYAHSAKDSRGQNLDIVHRDISPPNIMISYGGEVKLTDFGVSKATIKVHQTLSGALKGKLLYMSPEQARADRDIDHRSDLYSVGIILYELLTGRKLFMEASEMKVLKRVQQGQFTPPSKDAIVMDPELERILLKSLSLNRDERYQSGSDMLSDLESYLLSRYDHIPGYLHLAHFMNDLFEEDMAGENVKIALKPLPYSIQRLPQKPSDPQEEEIEEPQAFHIETTRPEEPPPAPSEQEDEPLSLEEPEIEFLPLEGEKEISRIPPLEPETMEPPEGNEEDRPPLQPENMEMQDPLVSAPVSPHPIPPVEPEPPTEEPFPSEPEMEASLRDSGFREPEPGPVVPPEIPEAPRPTFEISLDEDPPKIPEDAGNSIRIDDELAALDRSSGRRSRTFLLIILALAAVAAGVVFIMMNRTAKPEPITPPAAVSETREQAEDPLPGQPETQNETTPEQDAGNISESDTSQTNETEAVAAEPPKSSVKETKPAAATPTPPRSKPVETSVKKEKPETRRAQIAPPPPPAEKKKSPQDSEPQETTAEKPADDTPVETKTESESTEPSPEPATTETEQPTTPAETPPPPPKEVVREGQLATSVDTMPVAMSTPFPKLSGRNLRQLKGTKNVIISFLVDHNGKVERIKFIRRSGVPDIDMQIARTVSNWTYRPATKQGKKVKIWQTKSITIKK